MPNRKVILKILLNSLLGAILIFIWSRFVNLDETIRVLQGVDIRYLLLFFGLFLISGLLRAFRLKLLLRDYKIKLRDLLAINFLGQMLSFLIPIRVGELTKSVYLTSRLTVPLTKTVVWVFVDRFLDFWVVLLMISLLLMAVQTNLPIRLSQISFLLTIVFSSLFIIAIKSEHLLKKGLVILSHLLLVDSIKNRFIIFSRTVVDGLAILRCPPKELALILIVSLAAALTDSLVWLTIFLSLGVNLGVAKSLLGNSLSALSFLIPAAPGYVGSAEAAILAVFGGILGYPSNLVSAASLIFHILTLVTILIFGVSSLYFLKFDLGGVWKKLRGK